MRNRTDRRWPWPACGPLTIFLCVLSAFGWVMLCLVRANDRIYYWPPALIGLAASCTRIAVQSHRRMTARFSEQMARFSEQAAAAVQQAKDAAEDSVRNSTLVDRVTTEAVARITALPEPGPPPGPVTPVRQPDRPVAETSDSGLKNIIQMPHRAAS